MCRLVLVLHQRARLHPSLSLQLIGSMHAMFLHGLSQADSAHRPDCQRLQLSNVLATGASGTFAGPDDDWYAILDPPGMQVGTLSQAELYSLV